MKTFLFKNFQQFIFLLWVLLFFALFIQFLPQTSVAEAFIVPLLFLACAYPLTTYLSKNLLRKAIVRKGTAIFAVWFFLFSVLVGFLFFCCSFLFVILENEGYFPGTPLFSREEYFFYNLLVFITVGIFINLCFCGLRFFEENLKMQKSLLETQLQTLQNQITPHFMFNVLNHIHVVMQSDVDLASSLLVKYAEILRYQLYSGKKEAIPVEQEVQFLKDFVDIEKIRWEDKLNVQCSWKIENGKKEIVPLLLITFVENAFKHVSRETAGKGFVKIDLEQKGNTICLEVKNSKSTFPAKKRHSGLGLKNTRERLDILYPDAYSLSVEETDATYYSRLTIKA